MKAFWGALAVLLAGEMSLACTYHVDKESRNQEMLTLAKVSIDKGNVEKIKYETIETANFYFFESKPTPMCPDELTFVAEYAITYHENDYDPHGWKCKGSVKVTKIEPWVVGAEVTFKVVGHDAFDCKRP